MTSPSPPPPAAAPPPPTALAAGATAAASSSSSADPPPIICPGHSRPVPDIAYTSETPDGTFLVSACLDNQAMLRDGTTGDWIGTFIGHKGAVWSARLNADATRVLTASADFTAKLWDALNGDELCSFAHSHIVRSCAFAQNGQTVFTGGYEKKLRHYDLQAVGAGGAGGVTPLMERSHTAVIMHTLPLVDPHLVVAGGEEPGLNVWDVRTGSIVRTLPTGANVTGVQLSIDGTTISACTADKQVQLYDTRQLSLLHRFALPTLAADCVSYSQRLRRIITGNQNELWVRAYQFHTPDNAAVSAAGALSVATLEEVAVNKGHHGPVRSVAFAPDDKSYASGSVDGTIRIWNCSGAGVGASASKSSSA